MTSTYVNDLRLNEMATGDQSGSWGTVTNTNLELIGEAFSYGTEAITTNADTHTTTIADGATDAGRSMFLKYTGALDSACTITIGPNTVSKMWFIENATTGSQNIIISQGSGANITIAAGQTKVVYSNGAGAGAAFVDAFAALSVVDLLVDDALTVVGDTTLATADINGGTIDGTVIGGTTAAAGGFTDITATGNITVTGTVDGRDVAADGDKLDGIEALADVTDATNVAAALTNGVAALTADEVTQLANIGTTAISADEWGYVAGSTASFTGAGTDIISGTVAITYLPEATTAQWRDNTVDKLLSTDQVWDAMDVVGLTDGASIALTLSSGFDFSVTLAGDRTLANPTAVKVGQRGRIMITQDGTGTRTLAYETYYKFAAGTAPVLSTTAGAIDVLYYDCISTTQILVTPVLGVA